MFGANSGANSGAGGGFSFGSQPAPAAGNTGFSFGNASTPTNNNQPPAGNAFGGNSGGMFASTPTKPTLGAPPTITTNSGTQSGGFSFGGNTLAPANTAGSSGFSFGGNNNNSTAPAAGGFGAKPSSGFSLGGGTANTATSGTGGGFSFGGNNNSTTAAAPAAASTGFSFGNKPAAAPASSGFSLGGGTAAPAAASTGFSFGNKPAAPAASTGFSFGGNATGTAAPAAPAASTGFSLGGNTAAPAASTQPSFPWLKPQAATALQTQPTALQTQPDASSNPTSEYNPLVADQLAKLKALWDPSSPECLLQTHFYNKTTEAEALVYTQQRPANETPEGWDKAVAERPDREHVPVRAAGLEDVQKRVATQIEFAAANRVLLAQINDKTKGLLGKHDLDTAARIIKCKAAHARLLLRVLRCATILAVVKSKGYPLLPEEESMAAKFQELHALMGDPSGLGRVGELFARTAVLNDRASALSKQVAQGEQWELQEAQEKNLEMVNKMAAVLQKQQVGLKYLVETLESDGRKVAEAEQRNENSQRAK